MRTAPHVLLLGLGLAVLPMAALAACDDKKSSSDTARTDAGATTDKNATADPKLEKAILAAAAASSAATQGPPPEGVFAPGIADQKHAKGAPTTLEVLSEGSDPKVSLTPTADAAADVARAAGYGPAMLEVGIELGPRQVMPTVDLALLIGPSKDSADWLVADVKKAMPAQQQLGQLPPGIDKEIASLEGSQLRVKITPDGRESELLVQLGKDAKADLETIAEAAAESLVLDTVPLPNKSVGVGAQWIAETRMPLMGVDTLTYRAYRVLGVDGDRLHLSLDVKSYATTRDVALALLPKGATVEQFMTESQGKLDLVRGESIARTCEVQAHVVLVYAGPGGPQPPKQPGGQPGNVGASQLGIQATFVRGDDLRAMTAAAGKH